MKTMVFFGLLLVFVAGNLLGKPVRPIDLGASKLEVGEAGVAWYTKWNDAKIEAARSGRPIFFMAAATQCGSVSGVF